MNDIIEEEKTITLRKPITLGKENPITYSELHLAEPTAKELAEAAKAGNDIDVAITLIARVAQVPRAVAERLCQRDLKACADFFGRFNDVSQETPETSSPS